MLDDRKPFDVSTIEEGLAETISAFVPQRTTAIPRPSLRRLANGDHRPTPEPGPAHNPNMEESSGTPDSTTAILASREHTHGSFDENARVWQAICTEANRTEFTNDRQRLAFNMIALKLARLIQNPTIRDHWDDIAGYARLGADGC